VRSTESAPHPLDIHESDQTLATRRLPAVTSALAAFDTHKLAVTILFIGIFAMAVRAQADSDLWWHLQAGGVTVEIGRAPQIDLFSHTRETAPWVNHSWLSQVVLFRLYEWASYRGLSLWVGALAVATFAFVYAQMAGGAFSRAFVVVLAAATSAIVWTARPQMLSLLFTGIVAYVLYLLKWRGTNRLWLLPPLFVLWVNMHAGYALGFLLIACFVVGEALNRLLAPVIPGHDPVVARTQLASLLGFTLLSAVLLAINPNATRMWTYPFETVATAGLRELIQEWQSPDFHPLYAQPFIWMVLALFASAGLSGKRIDGTDLVTVGAFAYAALLAGRNVGPFAVVAAPVLSRHVAPIVVRLWTKGRFRPRRPVVFAGLNAAILLLVAALAAWKVSLPLRAEFNEQLQRETLPVGAVEWIERAQPQGPMFNRYRWGGYLIWRLWPQYRVFIDGRTDLYGDEVLGDYVEIATAGPRAMELLEEYGVMWAVIRPDEPLGALLECHGWRVAYEDDVAAVFMRSSSGG
jgi:hypothetical protein